MPREKRNQHDMFEEFQFLSRRVQRLGGVIQNEGVEADNEGVEADKEGLLEWLD